MDDAMKDRIERRMRERHEERSLEPARARPGLRGPLELALLAAISLAIAGLLYLRTGRTEPSVEERLKRIEEKLDRIAAEQEAAAAARRALPR